MGRKKEITYWACDFETTVWTDEMVEQVGHEQDYTEVWAGADVALYDDTERVTITHSIRDFLTRFLRMSGNNVLFFHNLSFDGSFIVDFLLREGYTHTTVKDTNMRSRQFKTSISAMGQWYYIKIKWSHALLEIRNSLKLMPSSLRAIGQSFKTKHQKLEMEYTGNRQAYCDITPEEEEYIKNDVLVLKEALEMMFNEGHNKLTIGSCCLSEFKSQFAKKDFDRLFPDIRDDPMHFEFSGYNNMWEYVHKSYSGGWCYVNPRYAHRTITLGKVYDVNSLYPSMMHSVSGNYYPYGRGQYCLGAPPDHMNNKNDFYYFVRCKFRFRLKPGAFPWLHIRGNAHYKGNENLYTSDIRHKGQYYRYYYDNDGNVCDTLHEFVLTKTDWLLLQDTYDLYDLQVIDHVWFYARPGMFDEYIDKYAEMKKKSKGFKRTLAKLFLNNLYGKFAMSDDSSWKEPYMSEDGIVRFILHEEHEKTVGYIPVGSAITSYARNFTIRHAIDNYDRFCYADTDSIHLQGLEPAEMVVVDPVEFCCWKNECDFDFAYYERQKTYAEHVIAEDGEECKPYLNLKASGMTKQAKQEFIDRGLPVSALRENLQLEDANLKGVRIRGGILLKNKTFKIQKSVDKKVNPVYNDNVIKMNG